MTPESTNQLVTELLLTGLVSVLALGLLASFSVMLLLRRRDTLPLSSWPRPKRAISFTRTHQPSVFDGSCRWLAVKTTHLETVQSALRLHNPVPCSWGEGLSYLARRKLFLSPPVRGWTLVIGAGLPDPADDVDACFHFLTKLSRALGHVQFFSVDRALSHHAWVRVENGNVRRAYAWVGETVWNQGPLTPDEIALGMRCFEYGEHPTHLPTARSPAANTDKVLRLAARWSFDPSSIDDAVLRAGLGVAGDVAHLRPH